MQDSGRINDVAEKLGLDCLVEGALFTLRLLGVGSCLPPHAESLAEKKMNAEQNGATRWAETKPS